MYRQPRKTKEKWLFTNAHLQKEKSWTPSSSSVELRLDVPACNFLGHPVEKLEDNKKLHAYMARIYPVLIGTFSLWLAWLKPILWNYRSLEFAREILKLMNETISLTLLSIKTKNKTKTKKKNTNKQTYRQAFSITYISMTLVCCWKQPRNIWRNAWRIVQSSISKIFIPKQHQIRIANVTLCTSYWKWQNPRIERILWNWTAKDTNGLLVSLFPPF